VSNGDGIGISLFVQGCHFHCKDCFNQETWDFNGGKEWTKEVFDKFVKLADRPYIKRISILGGEPLANENVEDVWRLVLELKMLYPQKKIWLYTGYRWENIRDTATDIYQSYRQCIVSNSDIVVDGQFQTEKKDIGNKQIVWAGSTNQRVIDVNKTIESSNIVLYGE
jgi:anaerobic ribonucleoside-triphosphate reductase activating protein